MQPIDHSDNPTERPRFLRMMLRDPVRRHQILFWLSLAALFLFGVLATLTYQLQELPFDLFVTLNVQQIHVSLIQWVLIEISVFGYAPWSYVTVAGGVFLVGWRIDWRAGLYLGALTLLQGIANTLIKTAIARPRPIAALVQIFAPQHGASFPSGHVMFYTVFFGFLFFLAWRFLHHAPIRRITLLLTAAPILLIGPSRIYLGAHWLSDVIAAYLLGLIFLGFGIEFFLSYVAPQ